MLTQDGYRFRPAAPADAAIVALHRAAMFCDMGEVPPEDMDLLRQACELWTTEAMRNETYRGWFIEKEGNIVAGGGLLLMGRAPGPQRYRSGLRAHILNIYTVPEHRRKGLARQMMRHILHWCAQNSIDDVTLGASDQGRPLYQSLGFGPTTHMQLSEERYREYFGK